MKKQDEKGKVGQETLGQGGLLTRSAEGSPRVQTGFHGLQCPRRERGRAREMLGPQTTGAWSQAAPRFSREYSGLLPLTTLSPADSRPEALLDLSLVVPVCVKLQISACIWLLFLNTQACAHETNGRQRLKAHKRHGLGIPIQGQGQRSN